MDKAPNSQSPTRRLTIFYIMALSSVALLVIIGQIVIQVSLQQQSSDALVINIAGRQRMLSQKISKAALAIQITTASTVRDMRVGELRSAVALWEQSHVGLQHGDATLGLPGNNSQEVTHLYTMIEPNYQAMVHAATNILSTSNASSSGTKPTSIAPFVQTILAQESGFLTGMNTIVTQYQIEAEGRVTRLKTIEITLLSITLIVLFLEGSFVFRPAARRLNKTIADIVALERSIAEQKHQLDVGIQQILQTHVQTANGDFTVRAPLSEDHALWKISHSLNILLSRLQRLSQIEYELQRTRGEATRLLGTLHNRSSQVEHEFQRIQAETLRIVEDLRDAKVRQRPIHSTPSGTFLDPLRQELDGNYLQPALPPRKEKML